MYVRKSITKRRVYSRSKRGYGGSSYNSFVGSAIRTLPLSLRRQLFKQYLAGLNKKSRIRRSKIMVPRKKTFYKRSSRF